MPLPSVLDEILLPHSSLTTWNRIVPWESLNKIPFSIHCPDLFPSYFWAFCPFSLLPLLSVDYTDPGLEDSWNLACIVWLYQTIISRLSLKKPLYWPALWNNQESRQGPGYTCECYTVPLWPWEKSWEKKTEITGTVPERCINVGPLTKFKETFFFFFLFLQVNRTQCSWRN